MKKFLRTLAVVFILAILGYLSFGIYTKSRKKAEVSARISTLSPFSFNSIDGRKITNKHISGKPLWLVFFDTNCEYCRMETENILKAGEWKDIQIWLVSAEPLDSLSAFAAKYRLNSLPHVQVLNDTHHAAFLTFNVTSFPASFLYDSNGTLIKQYKGVVKVETVLKDYAGTML
ncbi:peroxiredoxin family protein [Dyadobacter psychrotolerans]|uniref:TlpA family protein disulfide reductase n=1 Tax=Dyadobacter psychrotolerans TaxID=2541721 RepID=A0A4R5DVR4_9BACT|nr:TlpA disulfide reductase family protein [Dyadobacter psychrotolerans]TDE18652.1 TlpA family protein disulfide reductase [Dyadobacter psychrotolerans]